MSCNKNTKGYNNTSGNNNKKHELNLGTKSDRTKLYKTEDDAIKASFLQLEKHKIERIILGDKLFEDLDPVPEVRSTVSDRLQASLKEIATLKK